jgi:hypothetical protein
VKNIKTRFVAGVFVLAFAIFGCTREESQNSAMLEDLEPSSLAERSPAQDTLPRALPGEPFQLATPDQVQPSAMLDDLEPVARPAGEAPEATRPMPMTEEPRPPARQD